MTLVQFNLLPDVKLAYIKARRTKRIVMLIAVGAGGVAFAALVLLFMVVNVLQKQHLSNLNKDIKRDSATLQGTEDINKILTVQNQLVSLPVLHAAKPATTRLGTYLKQIVPAQVSISKLDVDFPNTKFNFSGSADSLGTINKFVDTLKFTDYQLDGVKQRAFSEVVLTSFGRSDNGANYQIDLKFDSSIFDQNKSVTLEVPNIISSRSETEKPAELFQPQSNQESQ